jgi:hypothetical protein
MLTAASTTVATEAELQHKTMQDSFAAAVG